MLTRDEIIFFVPFYSTFSSDSFKWKAIAIVENAFDFGEVCDDLIVAVKCVYLVNFWGDVC